MKKLESQNLFMKKDVTKMINRWLVVTILLKILFNEIASEIKKKKFELHA